MVLVETSLRKDRHAFSLRIFGTVDEVLLPYSRPFSTV